MHNFQGVFSIKWPGKVQSSMYNNRKLCRRQNGQKLQIHELLKKVYPKGQIKEITVSFSIYLDKIRPFSQFLGLIEI